MTPDGTITTLAGTGSPGYNGDDGLAVNAQLSWPQDIAVGDNDLYIADCGNSVIRKVTPDGEITTIAGIGTEGYSGDDGPAINAELADPHGIMLGIDGSLYVGEPRNHCIRKVHRPLEEQRENEKQEA